MTGLSKDIDFASVQAVLGIENPGIRQGLREALKRSGMEQITELTTITQFHHVLEERYPDVIILSSEIEGIFTGSIIRDIRHGRLGQHAFPLVVVLSMAADFTYVRKLVDCGADDILLVPVSPDHMLSRFIGLAQQRKPFVVTHDYIGPDRRKSLRPGLGREVIPMVDVPNPVQARSARISHLKFQRDVDSVSQRLNNLRVERYGAQIRWLDKVLNDLGHQDDPDHVQIHQVSMHLVNIADDLKVRTASWGSNRVVQAADRILSSASMLDEARKAGVPKAVESLRESCRQAVQEIGRALPHVDMGQEESVEPVDLQEELSQAS